ncbi:TPA: hypothetical protein DEP21_03490 [Patescibacteria group bacterium]|nr:hypothetical protein [Candidatus Gracilibacteria bacterium]
MIIYLKKKMQKQQLIVLLIKLKVNLLVKNKKNEHQQLKNIIKILIDICLLLNELIDLLFQVFVKIVIKNIVQNHFIELD